MSDCSKKYSSGSLKKKVRSCENLLHHKPDHALTHKHYHRRRYHEEPSHQFGTSFRRDNHRGSPQPHFECPVEVQTMKPLPPDEVIRIVDQMETEFMSRRKLTISGLPPDPNENTAVTQYLEDLSCTPVSKLKDGALRVVFTTASKAKESLSLINSTIIESHKLSASYSHPDSLLFVGNLPFTYTREDLLSLFKSCGEILRCFIVHSPQTGLSKGYGFVDFACREEALLAKQQNATKVIGLRSLRVDFSDNGMQTCEDLHSQTLFVDRLPKGFIEDGSLKEYFSQYGRVNFCQVALVPHTGLSRGFAFVDMSTSQEAEHAQLACNGGTFRGQEIRVSFGMPCRHGACILQHRSTGLHNVGKMVGLSSSAYGHFHESFYCPLPSYRDSAPMGYTFYDPALCEFNFCINTSLMRSSSLTQLPQNESPLPSPQQTWGVAKSRSAPTVLCSPLHSHTSHHHTSHPDEDKENSPIPRKRSAPELNTQERRELSVYDRPFIGQHQQGIPFMHPLKRIRTEEI